MARAALPRRLTVGPQWYPATVSGTRRETPRARTLSLEIDGWPGHEPGQHVSVRLTAEDGYQARRSYSIASAPEQRHVELTVERMFDGEVSPYLVDEAQPGDQFELLGPLGGYFRWTVADGGPLLLVAGGSGLVPVMAMLRHRVAAGAETPVRLIVSARTLADVLYGDELVELSSHPGVEITRALTRERPAGWSELDRRIDAAALEQFGWSPAERPKIFVCGSSGLVESVGNALVALGHPPSSVRTERFGRST